MKITSTLLHTLAGVLAVNMRRTAFEINQLPEVINYERNNHGTSS